MSIDPNDHAAVQTRLWDRVEKKRTGMLGLTGQAHQHFQPMTAFVDRGDNSLWFFAYNDSDLAEMVGGGSNEAMFVFQEEDLYACVGGRLTLEPDRARMERYWKPVVAAWYPDGKDDPRLTLMRLDCEDAQVWIVEAGPVRFGWEIAKANASRDRPDLGSQTRIDFH